MSTLVTGALIASDLLTVAVRAMTAVQQWNQIVNQAHAEGREPTEAELQVFRDAATAADDRLAEAIQARDPAGQGGSPPPL